MATRRAAACERNRADEADRKLGAALLECGRLRAALTARRQQAEGLSQDVQTPLRPAPGAVVTVGRRTGR